MKNAVRFLAVILTLATIVSVVGCSSGSKSIAVGKDRAVSMMQILPADTSNFSFLDTYMLQTDKNLSSDWEYMKAYYFGNDSLSEKFNGLVYTDELSMYEGDFTFDQFMGNRSNGYYNYGGFKISMSTYNTSAVMINSNAVSGYDYDVRRCIDVVNGNESSFYDNDGVKAIMHLLPSGIELAIQVMNNSFSSEGPIGSLVEGASWIKSGNHYVETQVYQFNSSDTAQQYVATASNVSKDGTMHIDRTQNGVFVTEVITPLTSTPTPTPTLTP
jgi:hypothetical protein